MNAGRGIVHGPRPALLLWQHHSPRTVPWRLLLREPCHYYEGGVVKLGGDKRKLMSVSDY